MNVSEDVIEYINKYWKPNQDDSHIIVEKGSEHYDHLLEWFTNHKEHKIDVGPFIGIVPYGHFELEENTNRIEFLFIYDKIDHTKLERQHLTLV